MNRVFVTGASGFIGSRLVQLLENYKVSIVMLSRVNQTGFETIICDLESELVSIDALAGVDTVFHLAGFAHDLSNSRKNKHLYHKINVDATVRLAEIAIQSGVKRFVFVSSVKAGGPAVAGQCMTEDNQSEPEGIYGKTKREAELKLLEIGMKSVMHVSIVRSSLVYGPDVKGNLRLMLSGIKKGWFPPLPEIGNRRSMIHVDDLVRALLLIAEDNKANGKLFIATDGESYSSCEIYKTMCGVLNKPVPRWSVPKSVFNIIAVMGPSFRYKVKKLLGDEYYSSEKLQSIGFEPQYKLRDMNETSF